MSLHPLSLKVQKQKFLPFWTLLMAGAMLVLLLAGALGFGYYYIHSGKWDKAAVDRQNALNELERVKAAEAAKVVAAQNRQQEVLAQLKTATNDLAKLLESVVRFAVAGSHGRGRFVLCGGPHVFETGKYGLLSAHDNAGFLQNILRWLLADGDANLRPEATSHHALGTFFFNNGLDVVRVENPQSNQESVAYVERLLKKTGVLKALNRPIWMP